MKAGDEFIIDGKVYVAADINILKVFLGVPVDSKDWNPVCNYCVEACKTNVCFRVLYRATYGHHDCMPSCSSHESPFYFFLKPEVDNETGR